MKVAVFLALALCLSVVHADTYAVLVAGSNYYYNYRHQADICHAYHVLIDHGVKAENIITLAYDDIANSPQNPFQGKIFNQPDGKDVYAGCVIDYKGKDVNAKNFVAVLTGDSTTTGGKKVLTSGANDTVFVNFADHGGSGLIAVCADYLYADTLLGALKTMHTKNMYSKLVFYMEACESGSMFTNLPSNLNIFAHTASNPDESSWGFYCSPNDVVQGKHIGSCLGDTWSISWMEDSDIADLTSTTLDQQYNTILKRVDQSHPQKYGDLTMKDDTLDQYQGASKKKTTWAQWFARQFSSKSIYTKSAQEDSRRAKLNHLKNHYERNQSLESFKAYLTEVESVRNFDKTFAMIDAKMNSNQSLFATSIRLPEDLTCLRNAVETFEKTCMKFTDYGLKYTKNLAHLCYSYNVTDFATLFKGTCTKN